MDGSSRFCSKEEASNKEEEEGSGGGGGGGWACAEALPSCGGTYATVEVETLGRVHSLVVAASSLPSLWHALQTAHAAASAFASAAAAGGRASAAPAAPGGGGGSSSAAAALSAASELRRSPQTPQRSGLGLVLPQRSEAWAQRIATAVSDPRPAWCLAGDEEQWRPVQPLAFSPLPLGRAMVSLGRRVLNARRFSVGVVGGTVGGPEDRLALLASSAPPSPHRAPHPPCAAAPCAASGPTRPPPPARAEAREGQHRQQPPPPPPRRRPLPAPPPSPRRRHRLLGKVETLALVEQLLTFALRYPHRGRDKKGGSSSGGAPSFGGRGGGGSGGGGGGGGSTASPSPSPSASDAATFKAAASDAWSFADFLDATCRLRLIDTARLALSHEERLCLALNLYHTLWAHACLVYGPPKDSLLAVAKTCSRCCYALGSGDRWGGRGGDVASLAELEHLVLRGGGGAKPDQLGAYWLLPRGAPYDWLTPKKPEPRVTLALLIGSKSLPNQVPVYRPHTLEAQLQAACARALYGCPSGASPGGSSPGGSGFGASCDSVPGSHGGCVLRPERGTVVLPKVMQWYRADFAGASNGGVLAFARSFAPPPQAAVWDTMEAKAATAAAAAAGAKNVGAKEAGAKEAGARAAARAAKAPVVVASDAPRLGSGSGGGEGSSGSAKGRTPPPPPLSHLVKVKYGDFSPVCRDLCLWEEEEEKEDEVGVGGVEEEKEVEGGVL